MPELKAMPPTEADEYEPPAYGTKGFVLVEVLQVFKPEDQQTYRFEIGEGVCDGSASPFWIQEGVGLEFWLDGHAPDDLTPGWWVFEGVVGTYIKGDWGFTDDDEEWEYDLVRPATKKEIRTLHVEPKHGLKTRGRGLFKQGWLSVCSWHLAPEKNCKACQCGWWDNLFLVWLSQQCYRISPELWRRWANRHNGSKK